MSLCYTPCGGAAVVQQAPLALTTIHAPYIILLIYDYTPCGGAAGTTRSYYLYTPRILYFPLYAYTPLRWCRRHHSLILLYKPHPELCTHRRLR